MTRNGRACVVSAVMTLVASICGALLVQQYVSYIHRFKVGMTLQEARAVMNRDYWAEPFALKSQELTPEERATTPAYIIIVDKEWIVLTFNVENRIIDIDHDEGLADPKRQRFWRQEHWQGPEL